MLDSQIVEHINWVLSSRSILLELTKNLATVIANCGTGYWLQRNCKCRMCGLVNIRKNYDELGQLCKLLKNSMV